MPLKRTVVSFALAAAVIIAATCSFSCERQGRGVGGKTSTLKVLSASGEIHKSKIETGMVGVDFNGMTPDQKNLALAALNEVPCACGCRAMTVAECRVGVTDCDTGKQQADFIMEKARASSSEGQIVRELLGLMYKRGGQDALLASINPNYSKAEMVSAMVKMMGIDAASFSAAGGGDIERARLIAKAFLQENAGVLKALEDNPDELYLIHGVTFELLPPQLKPFFEYFLFAQKQELQGSLFPYLNKGMSEADMLVGAIGQLFKEPEPRSGIKVDIGNAPSRGPADAPYVIVEFADYQCPFCLKAQPTIEAVWNAYPGKVRHVIKFFPLNFHPFAEPASRASLAAGKQGKFWEYSKLIFDNQARLPQGQALFDELATTLALNVEQFNRDMESPELKQWVQNDYKQGAAIGVQSTPTFIINGTEIRGARSSCSFVEAFPK